jgi:Xaa-Pro aminopeptidase
MSDAMIMVRRKGNQEISENEIMGVLLGGFYARGLSAPSYNPIVGGHANACVLHYLDNNAVIPDNSLTLIDAGGEYYGYCADITRTIPTGKTFTMAQRTIYDLVLAAQRAATAEVREGKTFDKYHLAAVRVITQGLIDLGWIAGDLDCAIGEELYKPYFMHRTGHFLGLDTHDVGVYRAGDQWRTLKAGMILTVEPGIYIRPSALVPEEYHHIGIRLEDDFLVTAGEAENLTHHAPIDPQTIENLR